MNFISNNIQSITLTQSVSKNCLEVLLNNLSSSNQQTMRDDQACLLALVCFTFMMFRKPCTSISSDSNKYFTYTILDG